MESDVDDERICIKEKETDKEILVTLYPPDEGPEADTDQDSDDEHEPNGLPEHLPGRILRAGGMAEIHNKPESR